MISEDERSRTGVHAVGGPGLGEILESDGLCEQSV